MRRLLLATVAGAALVAGATAASAQYYSDDGYAAPRGPFVERGVGLQLGPVGIGVYDNSPTYDGAYSTYGNRYHHRGDSDHSTYNSRAFRSQEIWPQSPPGGS